VTNNLHTLATALCAATDDLLKRRPDLAPWRPAVGISPQFTDAEPVTLAMMQAMLGFTSETSWLRYARAHLRRLFPYPPQQPGYNKRLRKAAELLRRITRILAISISAGGTRLHVDTVRTWLGRFAKGGLPALVDGERSGRPPRFAPMQVAEAKSLTCQLLAEVGVPLSR
jgi:hypothetical protein